MTRFRRGPFPSCRPGSSGKTLSAKLRMIRETRPASSCGSPKANIDRGDRQGIFRLTLTARLDIESPHDKMGLPTEYRHPWPVHTAIPQILPADRSGRGFFFETQTGKIPTERRAASSTSGHGAREVAVALSAGRGATLAASSSPEPVERLGGWWLHSCPTGKCSS
jgi:hypothetical protein